MKKIIVFLILISILLVQVGCKKEEVEILNVYNWGEYISDGSEGTLNVNEEFEKYYFEKYGKKIKVNYTTYASNEDMYNKLKSGGVSYDIVIPSDYMIEKMIQEDMVLELNFDNIPNYKNLDEQYKNAYYDKENKYTVPYFCGYVGIIYNKTMVEEEVSDWDIMWDEKYGGQILQFNNPRDAFGTAMYRLGIDVNTKNEEDWHTAMLSLKEQKDLIQSYVMDEIFNKMKNGSAAISSYYAGDFLTMYEDNQDLAFFYPESGTNIFVDAMCIPSCSKNKRAAEEYIDFCLTEDIAVANAEYVYYASPNVLVRESEIYREDMSVVHPDAMEILYPTEGIKASYYQNLDIDTQEILNSKWEELKIDNAVEPWVYVFSGSIVFGILAILFYNYINKKINSKFY